MYINGERLRKARVYRNLSISELAEKIGVTRQAISQYEKNQITPKSEILFQLISALKFPLAFFTESKDANVGNIENTFFRALLSAKSSELETQRVKTEFVFDIYKFLSSYLSFPELDLPVKDYEDETPEDIADHLRAYWNLGSSPIPNMVSLLEKKGIIVSSLKTSTQSIDAFTQIHVENGIKHFCIVFGSDKQSMVRRNFDAAHELGHILMHKDYPDVTELDKEEFKAMENEANQFAAAFLLPRDAFYSDLIEPTKLEAYTDLKKKWKVSIAAMMMRARQVGRITPAQYQNLMKLISFKKWRKNEPFDDIWQVSSPQLFKQSISILVQNEILSPSEIVNEFGKYGYYMNSEDVEELIDLEPGTLTEIDKAESSALVVSIKKNQSE